MEAAPHVNYQLGISHLVNCVGDLALENQMNMNFQGKK